MSGSAPSRPLLASRQNLATIRSKSATHRAHADRPSSLPRSFLGAPAQDPVAPWRVQFLLWRSRGPRLGLQKAEQGQEKDTEEVGTGTPTVGTGTPTQRWKKKKKKGKKLHDLGFNFEALSTGVQAALACSADDAELSSWCFLVLVERAGTPLRASSPGHVGRSGFAPS
ncbi:unnamed protein product [Prorocentrum cordatum]|uniref:Uncharacterized protein n=1 Tax=Prorocentrum cordatum TaxID=2364126 RepID=A0ABN9X811_9DINO|nr:unnamed protein product [Polarella glacialis]